MSAAQLSLTRKVLLGALLTLLLGGLLVGGLELGLRLAGFGAQPGFARRDTDSNGKAVWRDNRDCTVPWFGRALARKPVPFSVPADKAPGTLRVVVLGSSAAMGDPEPSFSLARTLEVMLREAYPGRRIEVINAAITAINSHVVRSIAEDCARLEPDLFIVYEGNNEVIGPFGPAGVWTPFMRSERLIRTATWIKGLRTGQLIGSLGGGGRASLPKEWGGMQMFLQQKISDQDPRLEAVAEHLRQNLAAISLAAHKVGASTILCTVPTNERDFAPFLSVHDSGLSEEQVRQFNTHHESAIEALRRGANDEAEKALRAAFSIDEGHAETVFRLGRLALAAGRLDEAKTLLSRARDLDALRFRTDSRLNAAIRALGEAKLPDCRVADLDRAFAARARLGVTGDEFFLEHVHFSMRGVYTAALELLPLIQQSLHSRGFIATKQAPLSYDAVREALGYTIYEQAMIQASLMNRFRGVPFSGQSDQGERLAQCERLSTAASRLLARPEATAALSQSYEAALRQSPEDWILARNFGSMLVARGQPAQALPHLQRADQMIGDDIDTLIALGAAFRALKKDREAEAVYARARRIEPDYPGIPKAN